MDIRRLRLVNFRGFDQAEIELRPLTVLLGANSSGKSSFGHAIASMAHAQWAHAASRTSLTPNPGNADQWPVDLGTLQDLRHVGATGPVFVALETSEGWVSWGFGENLADDDPTNLSLSRLQFPPSFEERGTPIRPKTNAGETNPTQSQPFAASGSYSVEPIFVVSPRYERVGPVEWRSLGADTHPVKIEFDGLVPSEIQHRRGTSAPLNNIARNDVLKFFGDLSYLRASRARPERLYGSSSGTLRQSYGYGGESAPAVFLERSEDQIVMIRPPAQGIITPIEEWTRSETTLASAVDFWLERLGLAQSARSSIPKTHPGRVQMRISLSAGRSHDITEVGFGISQVFPVLLAGLLQGSGGPLVVDLPEAHLHPRPQADLADFFCSLAMNGRSALVETHSEMFINQLRLRIAMMPDLNEIVAVYFLDVPETNGSCCLPRRVGLEYESELQWPVGFMQEAWEIESQIARARGARRSSNT